MKKSEKNDSFPFKHEKTDDSPGFLLWKITSLWQRKLALILGEFKITQTQYAILASLLWFQRHNTPTTQAHLVEHTKIDKMTLSKAVRKLQTNGLVAREASPTDHRAIHVGFTESGYQVILKAIIAIEAADEEFFGGLSDQQLASYKEIAQKILNHKP